MNEPVTTVPEKTGPEKAKRRMLSIPELFRLREWMVANKKAIEQEKFTMAQVAARASEQLSLDISASTIDAVAKDIGISFARQRTRPGAVGDRVRRVARYLRYVIAAIDAVGKEMGTDFWKLSGMPAIDRDDLKAITQSKPHPKGLRPDAGDVEAPAKEPGKENGKTNGETLFK